MFVDLLGKKPQVEGEVRLVEGWNEPTASITNSPLRSFRSSPRSSQRELVKGLLIRFGGKDMVRLIGSEEASTLSVVNCATEVVVASSISHLSYVVSSDGEPKVKLNGVGTVFLTNFVNRISAGVNKNNGTSKSER